MEPTTFRIADVSSQRLLRIQKIAFVLSALPLAVSSWDRATAPGQLSTREASFVALLAFMALANLAVALFYRRLSTRHSNLPERLLFGLNGVLYLADATDKMLEGARAIHFAYMAVGVLNLALAAGLLDYVRAYRTIELGPDGVKIRRNRFRWLRYDWSDVVSFEASGRDLRLKVDDDELEVVLQADEAVAAVELEAIVRMYRDASRS